MGYIWGSENRFNTRFCKLAGEPKQEAPRSFSLSHAGLLTILPCSGVPSPPQLVVGATSLRPTFSKTGSILLSHPERVILQPASPPPSLLAVAHPSCPLPQEQLPVELTVSTAASFLGHVANSVTALGMCHHSQGAPRSRGCPSLKLKLSGQLPFKSLSRL